MLTIRSHSPAGAMLVAGFESLVLTAYQDDGGVWTIGYGHTASVNKGDCCTHAQALAWLGMDMHISDSAINTYCADVDLNQNQYDALSSLIFNIGTGAFKHSTVLAMLRENKLVSAADAFLMWDKIKGNTSQGLLNRRRSERLHFLAPIPTTQAQAV